MTLPPFIQKLLPKRASASGGRPNPARDWALLLSLVIILLVAGVAWSALLFLDSLEEPAVSPPVAEQEGDGGIDALRSASEARAAEEARYRNEYRFIDPSK